MWWGVECSVNDGVASLECVHQEAVTALHNAYTTSNQLQGEFTAFMLRSQLA